MPAITDFVFNVSGTIFLTYTHYRPASTQTGQPANVAKEILCTCPTPLPPLPSATAMQVFLILCSFALSTQGFALQTNRNNIGVYNKPSVTVTSPSRSSGFPKENVNHHAMRNVKSFRGGSLGAGLNVASPSFQSILHSFLMSPTSMFSGLLVALVASAASWKVYEAKRNLSSGESQDEKPAGVRALQMRFLGVFWLMRMADWLQGSNMHNIYTKHTIHTIHTIYTKCTIHTVHTIYTKRTIQTKRTIHIVIPSFLPRTVFL